MKIDLIAGARPNFVKIAPLIKAIESKKSNGYNITYKLVHTGQHYDKEMSGNIFEQLGLPEPFVNLKAGGGSQAEQTATIMVRYEKELMSDPPDVVMVVGDVTSTLACSIAAKKLNIQVSHVEAGIRSGDMTMPEEINRIVTDSITDQFFTTSETANEYLKANGIAENRIHFVGNTMIDTLLANQWRFRAPDIWKTEGLEPGQYLLMTLHRPANVDEANKLTRMIDEILMNSESYKIIFPVHPRTAKVLFKTGLKNKRLIYLNPMGYLEFNYLLKHTMGVLTDSGGITEEASVLGIPCLTLRNSTERPETVSLGTNLLVGTKPENLKEPLQRLLAGKWKKGKIPPLWDGKTSERIISKLLKIYG